MLNNLLFMIAAACELPHGVTIGAVTEHRGKVTWHFNITDEKVHALEIDFARPLDGLVVDAVGYTQNGIAVPLLHDRRVFGDRLDMQWLRLPLTEVDVRMHVYLHPAPIIAGVCGTP